MNLFDRHRKFRNKLSAYIDGELSSDAVRSLDAHLESCDSCRLELDEMRATVDALRSISQVEAPRSFRLTPAMVAERRPATSWSPSPGLMNGMRTATAGLTMALVIVFVADLGGSGQGSDGGRSLSESAPMGLEAGDAAAPTSSDGDVSLNDTPTGGDGSAVVEDATGNPDSGGAQTDDFDEGTDVPAAPAGGETTENFDATSDPDRTSEGAQAELGTRSGDGFDELLAAEIALGAALALAAAGTAGMTFARSRARQD